MIVRKLLSQAPRGQFRARLISGNVFGDSFAQWSLCRSVFATKWNAPLFVGMQCGYRGVAVLGGVAAKFLANTGLLVSMFLSNG